jgi:sensor histidine kinase YesM
MLSLDKTAGLYPKTAFAPYPGRGKPSAGGMGMRKKVSIRKLIYNAFFSMKIKTKFFLAFVIIILIIGPGIGITTYTQSDRVITDNTEQLSCQIADQIAVNVELQTKEFERFAYDFLSDSKTTGASFDDMFRSLNGHSPGYNERHSLGNIIATYVVMNNMPVQRLYLCTSDGPVYYWDKDESGITDATDWDSGQMASYREAVRLLPGSSGEKAWVKDNSTGKQNILFAKEDIDKNTLEKTGDIIFVLPYNWFQLLSNRSTLAEKADIAVLNDKDRMIMADGEKTGKLLDFTKKNHLERVKFKKFLFQNTLYAVSNIESVDQQWHILIFIPMPELQKNLTYLKVFIFLFCLGTINIAFWLAFLFASNLTKNIALLEKSMNKVEKGDFSVLIHPVSYDEIGMLALRFNYMTERIHNLIDTVYKDQVEKQKAKYQMLVAQINPHFLYNTLGSIRWLANKNGQPDIEAMVGALIHLLRSSSHENNFVTVGDEINNVKNYIILQKFRYENRFQIRYEIASSVEPCYMLKLVVQPLVENALYHGIDMVRGDGLIVVRAFPKGKKLIVEVEDNGVGMDPETVGSILKNSKKENRFGFNGIGIHNVNDRIRLFYGPDYGLSYKSSQGKGTTAVVEMPLIFQASEVQKYDPSNDR